MYDNGSVAKLNLRLVIPGLELATAGLQLGIINLIANVLNISVKLNVIG